MEDKLRTCCEAETPKLDVLGFFAIKVLDPLPDIIAPDLDILFIGMNPGEMSSKLGHHYCSPRNSFWECLYKSGLLDRALTYEDDYILPSEYKYGLTNLVERPTVASKDLSRQEMRAAIPELKNKIVTLAPKIACILGKQLGELVLGGKLEFGLQDICLEGSATWIFVCPSTSGLATNLKKEEKISRFLDLLICLEFLKSGLAGHE